MKQILIWTLAGIAFLFILISGLFWAWTATTGAMADQEATLYLDTSQTAGFIKPLHGINNGPKSGYEAGTWKLDTTHFYQDAGIPIVRTHDTEYPYGQDKFIDIHCIFPDFSRDPDDPSAYHFDETDQYIAAITASGAQVMFRLGESIDYSGQDTFIQPPVDFQKWAQVCEHIVRHYNDGWADGFAYNIRYWEIWNEPENSAMWTGTAEEYCALYSITARILKQTHPEILVGCGGMLTTEAMDFFLKTISASTEEVPLDFASCHRYTNDPSSYLGYARSMRNLLDQYGFQNAQIALSEWNYLSDWDNLLQAWQVIQSGQGASFIAAALVTMQNAPIDTATYYDGQYAFLGTWCGLFDLQGTPKAGYTAFRWFNELCLLGHQVEVDAQGQTEGLYLLGTSNQGRSGLLLTFYQPSKGFFSSSVRRIQVEYPPEISKITITIADQNNPQGISTVIEGNFAELDLHLYSLAYIEAE